MTTTINGRTYDVTITGVETFASEPEYKICIEQHRDGDYVRMIANAMLCGHLILNVEMQRKWGIIALQVFMNDLYRISLCEGFLTELIESYNIPA
jgi:hypothetical protein